MPYHEAEIRAQKQAVEYQLNAQARLLAQVRAFGDSGRHGGPSIIQEASEAWEAMNDAGHQLQLEAARLAPHAEGYQQTGKTEEATQIIRTAHLLVDQGGNWSPRDIFKQVSS